MHSHLEGRPLRFPSLVFCILRFVYCIPYVVYFVSCISYFVLCILNFVVCVLYFVVLLSDPSPIIGNACQWLTDSLTHWLTHSCLVNLIDVTLACEHTNSKLVEVVSVADVDNEDRVGNSLLQVWELRFGHNAKLLFRLWSHSLVKILKLKIRRDFEAEVWSVSSCWCLVEVTKLILGQD